jgi:hypothetical protein
LEAFHEQFDQEGVELKMKDIKGKAGLEVYHSISSPPNLTLICTFFEESLDGIVCGVLAMLKVNGEMSVDERQSLCMTLARGKLRLLY